jgi:hypothetical protein
MMERKEWRGEEGVKPPTEMVQKVNILAGLQY